jgi:hypothetical protein
METSYEDKLSNKAAKDFKLAAARKTAFEHRDVQTNINP